MKLPAFWFEDLRKAPTAYRSALVAVIVLCIVSIPRNVYAQNVSVTPNTVAQGTSFQVSGTGFDPSSVGIVQVYADTSGRCLGNTRELQNITSDASGSVPAVTLPTSSLKVGIHCVEVITFAYDTASSALVEVTDATTIAPPTP